VVIELDARKDYGEDRYQAYGMAGDLRICVCFTPREEAIHLITIHRMHEKNWGKHYGGETC